MEGIEIEGTNERRRGLCLSIYEEKLFQSQPTSTFWPCQFYVFIS